MNRKFNLIVIGTGAAGATAAHKCRKAGWEVAIVDSEPFGGTCALRGCDPKKVLVGVAEAIERHNRFKAKGILSGEAQSNWYSLMQFKKTFTDPVPAAREKSYVKAGIATFHGRAKFISPNVLQVGEDLLEAKYILIAAGAKPAALGIPGEEHLVNSTRFLELEALPKRIIFVGGGYISFEFAHIARRAGAQVQILHRGQRPLEGFDADLVNQLARATGDIEIDLQLETAVEAIKQEGGQFAVHTSTKEGKQIFRADLIVHGAGRVPDIDDLDLDKGSVRKEKRGISVNEYLQSVSNPLVYAAGDAAASGGLPLTPVAGIEGAVAAANMIRGNHLKPDHRGVPTVVFTIPPLASVGLNEAEAAKQGLQFKVHHEDTSSWYSSRRLAERHSGYKVITDENTGRILGAHLLGPNAHEVINIFALAIKLNLSAAALKNMPWAYPTDVSDVSYMLG